VEPTAGDRSRSVDVVEAELRPVPRSGRYIALRPVVLADVPFLYGLAVDPVVGPRWRWRGGIPREENFFARLWEGVLTQLVVEDPRSGAALGLVSAFSANLVAGTAYVGAVLAPRARFGQGIEAGTKFASYLFGTYHFRKLYLEAPSFNVGQFRRAIGTYLHVEGCLKDHERYAGRCYDSYILAIYPDDLVHFYKDFPQLALRAEADGTSVSSVPFG